jgi:hypothetical protein
VVAELLGSVGCVFRSGDMGRPTSVGCRLAEFMCDPTCQAIRRRSGSAPNDNIGVISGVHPVGCTPIPPFRGSKLHAE